MMRFLLLSLAVFASSPVLAQNDDANDAPIPYEDDTEPSAKKPARKFRPRIREEDEGEALGEASLAHRDDPNIGVSFEVLSGIMLLDSTRGVLADVRYMPGVRITWEWGRLIPDEYLREMFFTDLTWQYTGSKDGTRMVNAMTASHSFTVAPAVAYPFGKSVFSGYAQVGAGLNYTDSRLMVDTAVTQVQGAKFLFQYGLGIRARPAIVADGSIRLSFRLEVTRFVRGYMHDMFIGGSVGVTL